LFDQLLTLREHTLEVWPAICLKATRRAATFKAGSTGPISAGHGRKLNLADLALKTNARENSITMRILKE